MGPLAKTIGKGIGLAKEYQASKKEQNSQSPSEDRAVDENDPPPEYESDEEELDAEVWDLDDAQHEITKEGDGTDALNAENEDGRSVDELLEAFFNKYPDTPARSELQPLPCPVILPQRRPKMNTRGFVHAYAPVLQGSGIDQSTWMDFLQGFHKAIKYNPAFHAVNASVAFAALAVNIAAGASPIALAVSHTIHLSIETARRGYTKYQTNKYLDTMNEKMFKPRGLYCLIMTYKPNSNNATEIIDVEKNTVQAVAKRVDGHGHKFTSSSGKTHGHLEMPESAPLIFPELDKAPEEHNVFKKGGKFLTDYNDRRAQARFAAQNPHSSLNVAPQKEFASRFSDPNHPASDGSLVALVTGGKVAGRKTRRARMRGQVEPTTGAVLPNRRGIIGTVKRVIGENVLYLMVVNLPSDEELAKASEEMKKAGLFHVQNVSSQS